MKQATAIIIGLVTALGGYFVWALHKRTKELMYAFVKASYVLIIFVLIVIGYGEVDGWDRLKEIALIFGQSIAVVLGILLAVVVVLVIIFRVKEHLEERAIVPEEGGIEDEYKENQ